MKTNFFESLVGSISKIGVFIVEQKKLFPIKNGMFDIELIESCWAKFDIFGTIFYCIFCYEILISSVLYSSRIQEKEPKLQCIVQSLKVLKSSVENILRTVRLQEDTNLLRIYIHEESCGM